MNKVYYSVVACYFHKAIEMSMTLDAKSLSAIKQEISNNITLKNT